MTKTGVVKKLNNFRQFIHPLQNTVSEFVDGTHTIHVKSCQSEQLVAKSENVTKVSMKLVISTNHVDEYETKTMIQNGGCKKIDSTTSAEL